MRQIFVRTVRTVAPTLSTPLLMSVAFARSNSPNYGAYTCFLHFSHFPQASVQNTCHLVSHVRCRCCWHWCPLPYMAPVYKCKSQRGNCKRSRNVSSKAAWIGFRVEHIVGEGWPMLSVGSGGCLTTAQVGRANNEFNWTKATATTPIGGQPCSPTNLTPNFFATKLLGYFGHIPPAITLINASFPKLFLITQYISKIPRFKLNQVSLGRLMPAYYASSPISAS